MSKDMSPDHFALCFTEALKCPDIQKLLKDQRMRNLETCCPLNSIVSCSHWRPGSPQGSIDLGIEKHCGRPELDQLEQHGKRGSLRFTGLPDNEAHDDTDKLILDVCSATKINPPGQPTDIAVSHRLGQKVPGKNRQIIVKFATRNIFVNAFSWPEQILKITT